MYKFFKAWQDQRKHIYMLNGACWLSVYELKKLFLMLLPFSEIFSCSEPFPEKLFLTSHRLLEVGSEWEKRRQGKVKIRCRAGETLGNIHFTLEKKL